MPGVGGKRSEMVKRQNGSGANFHKTVMWKILVERNSKIFKRRGRIGRKSSKKPSLCGAGANRRMELPLAEDWMTN